MAASTGEIVVNPGWTSNGSWCRRRAGVVELYLVITGGPLNADSWTTVAWIPSGYTPANGINVLAIDNGATDGHGAQVAIGTDGSIQVYKNSNTTNNLRIHATYLT